MLTALELTAIERLVRLRPALGSSNKEHRDVVEAIKRGDWREARSLHLKPRARTSREIVDLLEQCRLGSF